MWYENKLSLIILFIYLYAVGQGESRDFMAIVLYGGFIRVVISLGTQPLTLTVSRGPRLDDGEWHHVAVRQELKVLNIHNICKNHVISPIKAITDKSVKQMRIRR